MKASIYTIIIVSVSVGGCKGNDDINDLISHFELHRVHFKALADAACSYYVSFSQAEAFSLFEVDAPVVYPEHQAQYAAKMNSLLKEMKESRIFYLRSGSSDCSLFLRQSSFVESGSGSHIGYSYRPPKLNEYNPAIHHKDNRNTKENIYFTKVLADGWYMEYINTP